MPTYVSFYPYTYDTALEVLKKAKDPARGRLVANSTRLRKVDSRVLLRFHSTDIIEYLPNGCEIITLGGWDTVTTKARLNAFSSARIYSFGGKVHPDTGKKEYTSIWHPSNPISPPKVQKCRRCKGTGELPETCYGPNWCYGWSSDCQHSSSERHRKPHCPHGRPTGHPLPPQPCWRCKSEGVFDYGSNPIPTPMDASSCYLIQNGKVVGDWETVGIKPALFPKKLITSVPEPPSPSPYPNGAKVTSDLQRIIPGLKSYQIWKCSGTHTSTPCIYKTTTLMDLVVHLNDTHHWTREQIADWLEALDVDLSMKPVE